MAVIEMTYSLQRVGEQTLKLSVEERNLLSVAYGSTAGCRRAAWRIVTSVEQKEKFKGMEQQTSYAREYVAKVEDEIHKIRDGIRTSMDENLIPKRLNFVKDVVDSEDLHLNVYRETLQQNKILHSIKMNLAKKYMEMLAEIAKKKDDDYKKFYEQFGKRLSLGIHKAELLRFNTSKSGEEQIGFKEYVDRMREGQNDIYCITGESNAAMSSWSFRELLRKKGYEVLYMTDRVDEFAVQQPKEFDGTKLKQTMMEGLDVGDQDEWKTLEKLNMEHEPSRKLMKETLGDKVDGVIVSNRMVDSLRVLTLSKYGWSVGMQRSTQQRDSNQAVVSNTCKQHNKRDRKKERKGEGERGQSEQEEKGREEKGQEERETGERGKREEETEEERKEVQEETDKEVKKDMTVWVEVRRRTRRKSRKMVQIFVKVDGGDTSAMEMEMCDKVDDIVKKIQISDRDVYVTSGGRILRRSDKLESCEVRDGSTIQVTSRMRGGGKHKDKKNKVEKKQVAILRRSESLQAQLEQKDEEESKCDEGQAISEDVVQQVLETGLDALGGAEALESKSEGSDDEVDKKLEIFLVAFKKGCRLPSVLVEELEKLAKSEVTARRAAMKSQTAEDLIKNEEEAEKVPRKAKEEQSEKVRDGDCRMCRCPLQKVWSRLTCLCQSTSSEVLTTLRPTSKTVMYTSVLHDVLKCLHWLRMPTNQVP